MLEQDIVGGKTKVEKKAEFWEQLKSRVWCVVFHPALSLPCFSVKETVVRRRQWVQWREVPWLQTSHSSVYRHLSTFSHRTRRL
jgi:hypothetical protein